MRFARGFLAWTAMTSSSLAWAGAPVEGGKVYSGPEGVEVSIVTLSPRSKNQAIVLMKNTESELDGRAVLHDVEGGRERFEYSTQIHGRKWITVSVQSTWGSREYTIWAPGRRDNLKVTYDEKLSKELKPEQVYALYEKQTKEGTNKALQAFDRKAEEAKSQKSLDDYLGQMNKACGTKVTVAVDWKSVSDETLKEHDIASFCAYSLSSLERLCASEAAKGIIQKKVKKVSCQLGASLKLEVKDGAVSWITAMDAANQEEFATKFFEKNL